MAQSALVDPAGTRILVSELILPECASALNQIARGSSPATYGLSPSAANRAFGSVKEDVAVASRFHVLGTSGLMLEASDLAWKHGIKGADAVHLATALFARSEFQGWKEFFFVSSDRRQSAAAAAEGLAVIDPAL
jgi:predicted nucleic acid-binding protein